MTTRVPCTGTSDTPPRCSLIGESYNFWGRGNCVRIHNTLMSHDCRMMTPGFFGTFWVNFWVFWDNLDMAVVNVR